MITITDLTKTFSSGDDDVTAVDHLSFSVPDGTFASIVGSSGSGKSTLLCLLGGLDRPSSGTIDVDGETISSESDRTLIDYRRNTVGFVFQSFNLIPNLTALENVMLPMEFAGVSKRARQQRAAELLEKVGLNPDKQQRRPSRLSGGEQQRVAVARALGNQPNVILADEPTGNLDSKNGRAVFELLKSLTADKTTTVIVVTHDLALAAQTDVMFKLEDGRLVAEVTPSSP